MAMYRILKESNVQSFVTLSENPEAQDILAALKELRRDSRSLPLSWPSRSAAAGHLLKDGIRMQVDEVPISPQTEYRHGSGHSPTTHPTTSPPQPAPMYMQHFEPTHTNVASAPTPAYYSYPPAPDGSFKSTQPMQMHMHAQLLANQTHMLPQAEMVQNDFFSSRSRAMQMPEPWRPSPSPLTSSTNTPLESGSDHQSTLAASPGTYNSDVIHENMHMHQNTHTMVEQPPWSWGGGTGMNFYPNS